MGDESICAHYNWVAGNYIGTDANGTVAIGNNHCGVVIDGSRHNAIQANLISGNTQGGVRMACGSSFNALRGNCIGTAADGISALPNSGVGVNIEAASNTVGGPYPNDGNIIAYNAGDGIQIKSYPYNTIIGNSIHSHAGTGIGILSSSNNTIYHNNFISNTIQAYDDGSNSWDSGYPSGGNYWSDYTGSDQYSGPNQDIPGRDGIGDTPYYIPENGVDRYPLMSPTITPIPDIKVNSSDGPITLNQSATLTITVALDNNGITDNADFWLAADIPFGLYFYTSSGWRPYNEPVYQGTLFYLDSYDVFSTSCAWLEEGTYTFYFGVDTNLDGYITWDSIYYDSAVVNITE